ncbi:hypothetical protein PVAG01_06734 [Phlyctema vagabunda]|uniref:Uncharacterized protein n=1 Tax=Phlyctema vagabunda TaxID=108571 RepID=A0ABR4PGX4_9HELO
MTVTVDFLFHRMALEVVTMMLLARKSVNHEDESQLRVEGVESARFDAVESQRAAAHAQIARVREVKFVSS